MCIFRFARIGMAGQEERETETHLRQCMVGQEERDSETTPTVTHGWLRAKRQRHDTYGNAYDDSKQLQWAGNGL